MTQSPKSTKVATDKPRSVANLLLLTVADTTWRAFLPTIGGTFAGVGIDHLFKTTPYATSIMIPVGFVIAACLIVLQIKSVRRK